MKLLAFVLLASLAAPAWAQERPKAIDGEELPAIPPAPHEPDESITQHACTWAKLLNNVSCSWEFDPSVGEASANQAVKNARTAGEAAKACQSSAVGPDDDGANPAIVRVCEQQIAQLAIERCEFDGRFPLADAAGNLAIRARACVESILRTLTHAQMQAAAANLPPPPPQDDPAPPPAKNHRKKTLLKGTSSPNPT